MTWGQTARTIIAAAVAATIAAGLAAAGPAGLTVVVNGTALESDQAQSDAEGRLLLAEDALRHGLGLTVSEGEEGRPWTVRGFGRNVLVRPSTCSYVAEGEPLRAEASPSLRGGRLFVPLEMLAAPFEIESKVVRDGPASMWVLSTPGGVVEDVREGRHREKVRVVLDLDRPTGFSWWAQQGMVVLELPAPREQGGWATRVRLLRLGDPLVSELWQGPTANDTIRVQIGHDSPFPPSVFSVGDPPRIVIDLRRAPEDILPEPEPEPLRPLPRAAGVLHRRHFTTPRGPVSVYVLEVDPASEAIEVRPALAAPTVHKRATVASIAARCGAWGGVNGGFFARNGAPLGMLVIDGEWVREPWGGRTVLGITQTGEALMDRLSFDGLVAFAGLGTQKLSALNRGHDTPDSMVMYTRRWGASVEGAGKRTRLVVDASGVVSHKETGGAAVSIPEGGFVLSGIGRMAASLDQVEEGTVATVQLRTTPRWPELRHAIGGGPRLVKDGRCHVSASAERFRPDVYASRRSRTAVGITEDGRLLLVAAESAAEGDEEDGMTLEELATTMVKLGARQAMNLDGGGSTTFVADGRVLNAPSDGAARRVSNALLVFARAEAAGGG